MQFVLRIRASITLFLQNFLAIWPLRRKTVAIAICDIGALGFCPFLSRATAGGLVQPRPRRLPLGNGVGLREGVCVEFDFKEKVALDLLG